MDGWLIPRWLTRPTPHHPQSIHKQAPAPATPSSNAAADPGTPAAAGPDTHDWAAPLLALPGPGYDLLALSGAALLLAGHEHGRHLRYARFFFAHVFYRTHNVASTD